MSPVGRAALVSAGSVLGPSALSLGPVRAALAGPALSGVSGRPHVALTFDDGPDRASTPHFLRLLARLDIRATFFVLGAHADRGLLTETLVAGHELGVHGWDHRPVVRATPTRLRDELVRTRDLLEDVAGRPVRWYRPPYGLVTVASWWAAGRAGLRTVLWSAWGRDWAAAATPASVVRLVERQLEPGGTVLLHDSDRTSAPGSWRTTLAATEVLVDRWSDCGLGVGPLAEHWS